MKKLNLSHPKSPVQCCLLNEIQPISYTHPKSLNILRENNLVVIKFFYCDDEVSRSSPRPADYTSVMIGDKKVRVQTRHMLYTQKEAFEEIKLNHTDVKISLSKFCQSRPTFVQCVLSIPQNVCVCITFAEFRRIFNNKI